jgi:hypothetical protein
MFGVPKYTVNRSPTMNHLTCLIRSANAKVISISKTRNSRFSSYQIINRFSMHGCNIVPTDGLSGGLWLLWDVDVDIQVVHSSKFYILASCVYKVADSTFNLVCVYGDPHHKQTNLI